MVPIPWRGCWVVVRRARIKAVFVTGMRESTRDASVLERLCISRCEHRMNRLVALSRGAGPRRADNGRERVLDHIPQRVPASTL